MGSDWLTRQATGFYMGAMAEEIVFEPEPFVETCNRLYSKWKVPAVSNILMKSTSVYHKYAVA